MFTVFAPVRIEFCRAKLKYNTEHANETFEWIHVARNVSTSTAKAITLVPKNGTAASLPKRGIIVPNGRRSHRHKKKRKNKHLRSKRIKKNRAARSQYVFHDSFPIIKRESDIYNG